MIRPLAEIERDTVLAAIREVKNIPEAARQLGIGQTTIYRKLREYGYVAGTSAKLGRDLVDQICPHLET